MEASMRPDIIQQIENDEAAFLESLGVEMPKGASLTDVECRIDWLMQRISEHRDRIQQNNNTATARILMIENWRADTNLGDERKIEWLERQIRLNVPPTPEEVTNAYGKKSRKLPHGTFGFRRTPDSVEVTDAEEALTFAEANNLDVQVKRTVTKTTLKQHAQKTGEMEGEGWRVVEGSDAFYVTV